MLRRSFLGSCAGALADSALHAQTGQRPNVVLVLTDDMGASDIEPFGVKDIRTPNLTRLAQEGVRFTQAYSNGPVCTPTRAGLMTGRYQQRVGLEWALAPANKGFGLSPKEATLPRLLKDTGYATAHFGKWHLGWEPEFNPTAHGFDEYFGLLGGNHDMYSHKNVTGADDLWEGTQPAKKEGYTTELITQRGVDFINRKAGAPFFLYMGYNAVHWPFQPPNKPSDVRNAETWFRGSREDYKLMLEAIDTGIGQLHQALEKKGVAKNTIFVFTNDNGGERLSSNAPFFHHKGTLWEGGIRVPAIARWAAGGLPAGKAVTQPCISMDFTASILAAAGARLPEGRKLDGIDLFPIARGERPQVDRTLFWRIERPQRKQWAVRRGRYKLVRDGDIRVPPGAAIDELFDLEKDPAERTDLALANPKLVEELRQEIAGWETELARNPPAKVFQ